MQNNTNEDFYRKNNPPSVSYIEEVFPEDRQIRAAYAELTRILIDRKLTITTMESCTSGQIASLITDTEGSSAVLKGAFITYSNEAKIMQGVPARIIEQYGVYSGETARAMAEAARASMHADLAIGITGSMGNADPANRDSVPGQIYYAISCAAGSFSWFAKVPVQPSRLRYKLVAAELVRRKIQKLLPLLTCSIRTPDCHMHSTCSDGTDTPLELMYRAMDSGIDFFSITDHDSYDGCRILKKSVQESDGILLLNEQHPEFPEYLAKGLPDKSQGSFSRDLPFFISGVEFACTDEIGKYHILGYAFDEKSPFIQEAAAIAHTARRLKSEHRFAFLEDLGYSFTEEEKQEMLQRANPGRPHYVNLLLEKGYVRTREEGFRLMAQYHESERKLTAREAIAAIRKAGGLAVLAHGIHEQGSKHLSREEISMRVLRLKKLGLQGLECYYSTYTAEESAIMLELAEEHQMLITAGSDYHGRNKAILPGENGQPDLKKMLPFFAEIIRRS